MRVNLPITDIEYPITEDTLIVSTTDTKGRITYVNSTFIEVSRFSQDELIGKAHNIVRHPDMPPQAFEDLWQTLKGGSTWTGLVKNRRKNGDFYWIRANAAPIKRNGQVTGYLSVRTKVSQKDIDAAIPIYRKFLEDKADNLKIQNGQVIRTDLTGKIMAWFKMGVNQQINVSMSILASLFAIIGGVALYSESSHQTFTSANATISFLSFLAVATCFSFAFLLKKRIVDPINQATEIASLISSGELTQTISANRRDEFGKLLECLSQVSVNLRATILDIQKNAIAVHHASKEIATGNMDLSGRTEQQASALQETAASMEELTSTVGKNTDHSSSAGQLIDNARSITMQGGSVMKEVVTTMSSIKESSSKIADIITVIDGIAFQTNILALNAAVEAARAGEQGRGFAVVATEVRNLAQRSATAAKEIKALIDDSVQRVHDGTDLVSQAEMTMSEIVNSISNLNSIMAEITCASKEQFTGINQVYEAVSQMDETTQNNAALVEQSAAAAACLSEQAEELVGAISIFNATKNDDSNNVMPFMTKKPSKKIADKTERMRSAS